MKKIFLALSIVFLGAQLQAQLPVNWQTATPGSFTISGSTIRNNGWTPFTDYAYSQQKLRPGQDGYFEFSAENPGATSRANYQVGFAKASAPAHPSSLFTLNGSMQTIFIQNAITIQFSLVIQGHVDWFRIYLYCGWKEWVI